MKNVLTIFKKEWDRVIKDRRMILTVMILPGLMIFIIYSFIGGAMQGMFQDDVYNVAIYNPQAVFTDIYEAGEVAYTTEYDTDMTVIEAGNLEHLNIITIESSQIADYQTMIDNEEWGLLIVIDDLVNDYDGSGDKPVISLYQNPNRVSTSDIAGRFTNYIYAYGEVLSFNEFGDTEYINFVNLGTPIDESNFAGTLLSSMLPMLIIMFLFSGAMAIGPESIAGEKERGTIATLLVTPVKRSEIAMGKILGLSVLTLLSATSSFIGVMASLPKMLSMGEFDPSQFYGFSDYLMILLVLFSTVFVVVGVISIISAYAKNLKEAGSLIAPVYLITIVVAVSSMFGEGAQENLFLYCVPIYNTVQTLISIFTFDPNTISHLLVTISSNIVFLAIFVYILNKMFNSEKIMFAK